MLPPDLSRLREERVQFLLPDLSSAGMALAFPPNRPWRAKARFRSCGRLGERRSASSYLL